VAGTAPRIAHRARLQRQARVEGDITFLTNCWRKTAKMAGLADLRADLWFDEQEVVLVRDPIRLHMQTKGTT